MSNMLRCILVSCIILISSILATAALSQDAPACKEKEEAGCASAENGNAADAVDLSRLRQFASPNSHDALFGYIEESHANGTAGVGVDVAGGGTPSFGSLLDAGTGSHSLAWIASVVHRDRLLAESDEDGGGRAVRMEDFTAITADKSMQRKVLKEATELGIQDSGSIIIGNWDDEALLEGKKFDTILVDYLIGAIDGFSPYFQDQIFGRLAAHLTDGGRLYVVGLQPIPDKVDGDGDVFCRITKVRDACILLAGHRCYREYPIDWIERHVEKAGLNVVQSRRYPIKYGHYTMNKQIKLARSKLKHFPSKNLADSMKDVLDGLEREALEVTSKQPDGKITLGFDYVVVAQKEASGE